MHLFRRLRARRKGSALITVIFLIFMMGLLTTSMLRYSGNERRGNERNRLILRAKNMAENVALYASEQVSTKIRRLRSITPMEFTGDYALKLPPANVLNTSFSTSSNVEVYGGIASTTDLALITDTSDANYGLQVSTGNIPIVASATMTHPALGSVKAYVEQTLQINMVPLFQFAIFYNDDLEFSPGANMVISGPVHANGNLIARCQTGFTNTVEFEDRVTATGGFFAHTGYKGTIYNEYGNADAGPGGTGPLYFRPPGGTHVNIKNSSNVWRDHRYGGTAPTTTSLDNFKTFATNTYAGNLRTSVHQVPDLELPGVDDTDDNNGRTTIEPASSDDSAALKASKFSRNTGLYIVANPDDEVRTGRLPDNTTVTMLPRSYRAWLNTVSSSGTYTLNEVVLPGQPSYGYNNNGTPADTSDDFMYRNYLPNRLTFSTSVGSNQVLRLPQQDYGVGSGYLLSAAHAAGAETIAVDTGSGGLRAGETVIIGNFRYLVTTDLAAGSFKIAAPGLREAVADNAAVTLVNPYGLVGTAGANFDIDNSGGYAIGATTINLDGATGSIWPGNSINIAGYNYLVTSTPNSTPGSTSTDHTITIAAPGLRAAAANDVVVSIDGSSGLVGTAYRFFVNNAANYPIGTTELALDGDSGTIRPGTFVLIGDTRYLVSSTPGTGVVSAGNITLLTGLTAEAADNAVVTVDPYPNSGYRVAAPAVLTNSVTTIPDAFFYDLRRATNSTGYPFSRNTGTFSPRPVAKIDFDMARFKMAVHRSLNGSASAATVFPDTTSTTGYSVDVPNATNWNNNILKSTATTATFNHGLGTSFNVFPAATDAGTRTRLDPFRIYFAPSAGTPPSPYASVTAALEDDPSVFATGAASFTSPWYDGITVYIHSVDAEVLTESSTGVRNRIDSGVRLINGRGPAPSLSTTGKTGMSFGTNDAVYILGHFNADGNIDATSTDEGTGSPGYYGGYSGRYPDSSSEKLTSVMGDAITILSQPVFVNSGTSYYQDTGWSDALSGNRVRTTNYSTNWATTNPGTGNSVDGTSNAITPAPLPTLGTYTTGSGGTESVKFSPTVTEVSACLLTGIVETDTHQHSGGVHNFPRLLENWSGTGLYIRGSMVAMFVSEVATEYWSIRIYSGAGRYWGLHQALRSEDHDVPLEPILLNAQRLSYRELSETQFTARKTEIQAL
jgi:Tfp pilus assembly protein PilX